MLRRALGLLPLSLLVAGSAQAATVHIALLKNANTDSEARVIFTAAPGEANDVFAVKTGDAWVIRDNGAPLTPGAMCTALDANSVTCTGPVNSVSKLQVDTGDGNDTVVVPEGTSDTTVDGGDGDDAIRGDGVFAGGPGQDTLTGGPMADSIFGGPGSDEIHAGGGDDTMSGDGTLYETADAGGYSDILNGGDGNDTVTYQGRTTSLNVDLALGRESGADGEVEGFTSVENITGSNGENVLAGNDVANRLQGGNADDVIVGRGGNDLISGLGATNTLDGGEGDDTMYATGAIDTVTGGPGNDSLNTISSVASLDGGEGDDLLAGSGVPRSLVCGDGDDTMSVGLTSKAPNLDGCEHVRFSIFSVAVRPSRTPGMLGIPISCAVQAGARSGCKGTVKVSVKRAGKGSQALGHVKFSVAKGKRSTAHLRLTPGGRRTLHAIARPVLTLVVSSEAAKGSWQVTL